MRLKFKQVFIRNIIFYYVFVSISLALIISNQVECFEWSSPINVADPVPSWIGDNPSIAVDSDGDWHVAYGWSDYSNRTIYYITYKNSKGDTHTISSDTEVLSYPSLTIDANDVVHLMFLARDWMAGINYIKRTTNFDGNWSSLTTLKSFSSSGVIPYVKIDRNGVWHAIYSWRDYSGTSTIYWLTYENGQGVSQNIHSTSNGYITLPSFDFDSNDSIHIACRGTYGSILYISNASGNWSTPTIIADPVPSWSMGDRPSIVIDDSDNWHVFYGWTDNDGPPNTDYISYINSNGEKENIITTVDGYYNHPSTTIDSTGNFHLAYRYTYGGIGYIKNLPKLHALFIGSHSFPYLIKGKADAEAMYNHFKKYNNWADTNPKPLILSHHEEGSINRNEIQRELSDIESMVEPGDYFIFYYSGDGGYFRSTIADETPALDNNSDEFLHISSTIDYDSELTDDALKTWLDSTRWNSVNKWVILDSCYSGGFVGDDLQSDIGDLEKLQRVALSASAHETGKAAQWPFPGSNWGRGIFTVLLERNLEQAPDISVPQLNLFLQQWDVTDLIGEEVYVREMQPVVDDTFLDIFDLSYWQPAFHASDDFEMTFINGDVDGDGVYDNQDNCHNISNIDQIDTDEDGIGDLCDNCPSITNISQDDSDGNGVGDACEINTDIDGDGFAAVEAGGLDCNDEDPLINPDAEEVCGDGVDNNCNGEVDEGCVVLGDLNGDGLLDTADYYIFLGAFGKCDGQAGYNADCDYDGDTCITFIDYQTWYGYYLNQ